MSRNIDDKTIPMCPKCKRYEMVRTNCKEYFCTKCGCISEPNWMSAVELLDNGITAIPQEVS